MTPTDRPHTARQRATGQAVSGGGERGQDRADTYTQESGVNHTLQHRVQRLRGQGPDRSLVPAHTQPRQHTHLPPHGIGRRHVGPHHLRVRVCALQESVDGGAFSDDESGRGEHNRVHASVKRARQAGQHFGNGGRLKHKRHTRNRGQHALGWTVVAGGAEWRHNPPLRRRKGRWTRECPPRTGPG